MCVQIRWQIVARDKLDKKTDIFKLVFAVQRPWPQTTQMLHIYPRPPKYFMFIPSFLNSVLDLKPPRYYTFIPSLPNISYLFQAFQMLHWTSNFPDITYLSQASQIITYSPKAFQIFHIYPKPFKCCARPQTSQTLYIDLKSIRCNMLISNFSNSAH